MSAPERGLPVHRAVKVVEVKVGEYVVTREPDFHAIGTQVDRAIGSNFPDGTYIARAVGLEGHPGMSLDELVALILEKGTDKYDPNRRTVGEDGFADYDYDIHAAELQVLHSLPVLGPEDRRSNIRSWFGGTAWHFYHGAAVDRGHAVRLDLLILYDPVKVVRARKLDPSAKGVRRGLATHLYRFKDRRAKRAALLGVVKILR